MTNPRDGFWMTTKSGKRIYMNDFQESDFCIEDIAHGLSNMTRYSGQCIAFYSVAEHCWRGSNRAAETLEDLELGSMETTPSRVYELAYEFLLHDATEAYIGDMVHPLKLCSPDYVELETRMQETIARRYGVPPTMTKAAGVIDKRMLVTEAAQMFNHTDKWWLDSKYPAPFKNEWVRNRHHPVLYDSRGDDFGTSPIIDTEFMPPRQAKRLFLARFAELRSALGMDPIT